jgi:hypothetical protein
MQCLQGWVVKTHPLQVHRITLHPRGCKVMQLMQFRRRLPPGRAELGHSIRPLLLQGFLAFLGEFVAPAILLDQLVAL